MAKKPKEAVETKLERIVRYCNTGLEVKYDPEVHPKLLVDIFTEGQDICSFCVEAEVVAATFHRWVHQHEEFRIAYAHAKEVAYQWWMRKGIEGMSTPGFNHAVWNIFMRNRFGYTDVRKLKVKNIHKAKSATERHDCVTKMIGGGEVTASEANALANFVKTGAEINQMTNVVADVEKLKESLLVKK